MKKIILLSITVMLILGGCKEPVDGQYADLAQCLTEKGVKMYGAWWCPHCSDQKDMFGDDFRYIDYIECADGGDQAADKEACKEAGIESYPTWDFPGQERITGAFPPETLAKKANCEVVSTTETPTEETTE